MPARARQVCTNPLCKHQRDQHDKYGCTWPGCRCVRVYMNPDHRTK